MISLRETVQFMCKMKINVNRQRIRVTKKCTQLDKLIFGIIEINLNIIHCVINIFSCHTSKEKPLITYNIIPVSIYQDI